MLSVLISANECLCLCYPSSSFVEMRCKSRKLKLLLWKLPYFEHSYHTSSVLDYISSLSLITKCTVPSFVGFSINEVKKLFTVQIKVSEQDPQQFPLCAEYYLCTGIQLLFTIAIVSILWIQMTMNSDKLFCFPSKIVNFKMQESETRNMFTWTMW